MQLALVASLSYLLTLCIHPPPPPQCLTWIQCPWSLHEMDYRCPIWWHTISSPWFWPNSNTQHAEHKMGAVWVILCYFEQQVGEGGIDQIQGKALWSDEKARVSKGLKPTTAERHKGPLPYGWSWSAVASCVRCRLSEECRVWPLQRLSPASGQTATQLTREGKQSATAKRASITNYPHPCTCSSSPF